jgi:DEAD/DEAH box helicase domain-containing protein
VLTGLPFELVDRDGGLFGGAAGTLQKSPLKDEEKGDRRSMLTEGAFVFSKLVAEGVRTIAFAKSRKSAELIYRYAADRWVRNSPGASRRTAPATLFGSDER